MTEFLKWLSGNSIATTIVMISFGIVVISVTLIYVVAFFQGREISFWPPKIGQRPDRKISGKNPNETDTSNMFKIDRDIQGETGIDDIKGAKHTIHVTHFSGRTPQNDYIKIMIDKINNESIDTTRIIPNDLKNREWLDGFKKLGNKYTEKEVGTKLNFDMLIIDRKKVRLYFPASKDAAEFKKAIVFDEKEIADCFMTVFERL